MIDFNLFLLFAVSFFAVAFILLSYIVVVLTKKEREVNNE